MRTTTIYTRDLSEAPPRRLVLMKEDADSFINWLRYQAALVERLCARHAGVEIAPGERENLYVPRVRGVL